VPFLAANQHDRRRWQFREVLKLELAANTAAAKGALQIENGGHPLPAAALYTQGHGATGAVAGCLREALFSSAVLVGHQAATRAVADAAIGILLLLKQELLLVKLLLRTLFLVVHGYAVALLVIQHHQ
jgi:hypothetical protein